MKSFRIVLIGLLATTLLFTSVVPVGAQDEKPNPQNPVVVFLAGLTKKTPQAIADLQAKGYGLGNISKAIYYQQMGGKGDLQSILEKANEIGWGQLFKQAGLHPGGGVGWLFKGKGKVAINGKSSGWMPPGQAKKKNGWMPPGQLKNKDKKSGDKHANDQDEQENENEQGDQDEQD